jgi:hypothetical protein
LKKKEFLRAGAAGNLAAYYREFQHQWSRDMGPRLFRDAALSGANVRSGPERIIKVVANSVSENFRIRISA